MSGRSYALDKVPGLRTLGRGQHGMARREQLAALGVTCDHIDAQVAARRWTLAAPSVVAMTNGWHTRTQRLWLAVLNAGAPAWVTGLTGLEQLGMTGWHRDEIMVLIQKGAHPPRLRGIRYRETRRPPGTAPDLEQGLPCAPVTRCAIDGAGTERSMRTAQGLVIAVVQQRLSTPAELRPELAAARRIRHRRAIERALDDAAHGHESLSEVDVTRLVMAAGLGRPRTQAPGIDARGRRRRRDLEVDLADGTVLVIQVDGTPHLNAFAIWDDQVNDIGAAVEGKLVARIPALIARQDPDAVITYLRRVRLAAELRAA